ncbi:MAG: serine hydrolase [Chloroflexota bacterium]
MAARRSRRRTRILPSLSLISVVLLLAAAGLFVRELLAFSQQDDRLPQNIIVGSVNVSGMTQAEARIAWEQAYAQPITLYYRDSPILLDPAAVGFRLNIQTMLSNAPRLTEGESTFWARFFNHLTQQDFQAAANIPLSADYQASLLEQFLRDISARYDQPPGEPGYDLQTLTVFPGEPGFELEIDEAMRQIDRALRTPDQRTVILPIGGANANQPTLDTLRSMIIDYLDTQGFIFDGQTTTAGIFILDLQTGEEINLLGDVAFSAASTQKVAILLEYFRRLNTDPSQDEAFLMANSLLCSDNSSSNLLMEIIGEGNIFNGIARVTETMQLAGARNSYLSAPFQEPGRELGSIAVPPTNSNSNYDTNADPFNQITAEDIGTLYTMLYDCANYGSGLMTAFDEGAFNQTECRRMLELMSANDLERLLQGGIPPEVRITHKNGWLNTQAVVGDAGIVYPPNGRNYVIAVYLWEETTTDQATVVGFQELWPLLEDISRAAWNYFSPSEPLLNRRELPTTARDCEESGYLPPYGQVNLDDINAWRSNS